MRLFFTPATWAGTGFLLLGILLLLLPLLLLGWLRRPAYRQLWGAGLALSALFAGGLLLALLLTAPSGRPGPDSPVHHRFSQGGSFRRYSLTNLIPEIEQVNLGFYLMPYLDPILTREQAARVSTYTLDLYREMEADENFRELGSAMGLAYAQLLGLPFDAGHYYLYVPQQVREGPLPALIFLHGSAGNFKAYTWLWSKLAQEEGFVIIAPSYGFGSWDEAGTDAVLNALDDARQVVAIDPERIYLAGLSNGGIGAGRLAIARPDLFRGLIFLSPVMPTGLVDGETFQRLWADRPVLVLSGAADRRIPLAYVEERVARMAAGGIDVTSIIYPDEDHFLVFSRPEEIVADVAAWLRQTAPGTGLHEQ